MMMLMKKRSVIIFILLCTVLLVLFFYNKIILESKSSQKTNETISHFSRIDHPKSTSHEAANKDDSVNLMPFDLGSGKKIHSIYGTAQEEAEVKKWCSDRAAKCAVEQKNEAVYESYDVSTLEAMSKNGDIRAMHSLAERYAKDYLDKGDVDKGFELRNNLYLRAAAYGSTDALLKLGTAADTGSFKSALEGRELILEPLAYYEVAAMRGDRFGKLLLSDSLLEENSLILTDVDRTYIETRAEEIYQDLQRRRYELGLGEFDNDIPESVKRYFDHMQQ